MSDSAVSGVYENRVSCRGGFLAASKSAYQRSVNRLDLQDYERFSFRTSTSPAIHAGVSPAVRSAFSCTNERSVMSSQSQSSTSGDGQASKAVPDYIGLAEAVSACSHRTPLSGIPDLNLGETELKLGLPGTFLNQSSGAPSAPEGHLGKDSQKYEQISCRDERNCSRADLYFSGQEDSVVFRTNETLSTETQHLMRVFPLLSDIPLPFDPSRSPHRSITGTKRGYAEAMQSNFAEESAFEGRASLPNAPQRSSIADLNSKSMGTKLIPPLFPWGNVNKMAISWPTMVLDHVKVPFSPVSSPMPLQLQQNHNRSGAVPLQQNHNRSGAVPASMDLKDSREDRDACNQKPYSSRAERGAEFPSEREDHSEEVPSVCDDLPKIAGDDCENFHLSSAPVVGWPPVQSFRNKALATPPLLKCAKKSEPLPPAANPVITATKSGSSDSLFVKVYVDGIPIGRKVDLKNCDSYKQLSLALEEMFHFLSSGHKKPQGCHKWDTVKVKENGERSFFHGSEYVLTYEDRDGDLMLVGDVPWSMFLGTVKRLRIMKGSAAIGLAPKASVKGNAVVRQF